MMMKMVSTIMGAQKDEKKMNGKTAPLMGSSKLDYLMATIQCLGNAGDDLPGYFLSGDYQQDLNVNNPLGSGGKVATDFAKLLQEMWMTKDGERVDPTKFYFSVCRHNNLFAGITEGKDAAHFTSYLIDVLAEDLNRIQNKPNITVDPQGPDESDAQAAKRVLEIFRTCQSSRMDDLFSFQIKTKVKCKACSTSITRYHPEKLLKVEIPTLSNEPEASLFDCIDLHCQEKTLKDVYCSTCKDFRDSRAQSVLYSAPRILVVILQRAQWNHHPQQKGPTKSQSRIDFPLRGLDLSSWVLAKEDEEEGVRYDCFGVISHRGGATSGSCSAHVLSKGGVWCHYNAGGEMSIVPNPNHVVTKDAYLIFYRRLDRCSKC